MSLTSLSSLTSKSKVNEVIRYGWIVLLSLLMGCLPEAPGISIKIKPVDKSGEDAKSEIIEVLTRFKHQLIFAPSPEYPISYPRFNFDGYWSDFGSKKILGAAAIVKDDPSIMIGVNYSFEENEFLVAVSYVKFKQANELSSYGKIVSRDLLELLEKFYGNSNVVIVREKGAL